MIRLLLVEDNELDADLVLDALQEAGIELTATRVMTAPAFLSQINSEDPPDLILADYTLPQFSAPEALRLLQDSGRNIPIIIVTGTISEEVAVECMRLGAADYLLKDRLARLGQAVRTALAAKAVREEARRAEEALRVSEGFNRAILESLSAQIAVVDSNGVILAINNAWRRVAEQGGDETLEKTGIGVNYLAVCEAAMRAGERDAESAYNGVRAVLDRRAPIFIMEYGIELADGDHWYLMRVTPLTDSTSGAVISHSDISEQHRAELNRLSAEILRGDLEKERALRAQRDQFISTLSHDFRTPLSVIQVNADLLSSYHDRISAEKRVAYLDGIKAQIRIMVGMIDDVLAINRAQMGRLIVTPGPISLVAFCRSLIGQTDLGNPVEPRITLSTNGDLSHIVLDEKLLRHILTNLLTNALKYSPSGSTVSLEIDAAGSHVVFRVRDQGIGIPATDLPHLFEPFFRARNTGKINGTGLGLAIVKASVEAHGGTITVDSAEGIGTTFTVTIPNGPIHRDRDRDKESAAESTRT